MQKTGETKWNAVDIVLGIIAVNHIMSNVCCEKAQRRMITHTYRIVIIVCVISQCFPVLPLLTGSGLERSPGQEAETSLPAGHQSEPGRQ